MGNIVQHRGDIGIKGEHRPRPQHRGEQRGEHLGTHQHRQLLTHFRTFSGTPLWQREEQRDHGDHAQHRGGEERHTPADGFSQPGGCRNAADISDRQAHKHGGDRTGLLMFWHHAGSNNRAQSEEGAMVEAGQNTGKHQRGVIRRNCGKHISESKNCHQENQRIAARTVRKQQRHQRRAHHHADRVGAD